MFTGFVCSPITLPPVLDAEKLTRLAVLLPNDRRLAIGSYQIQKYYTSNTASCIYDSHGKQTLIIHLKFKKNHRRLNLNLLYYKYLEIQVGSLLSPYLSNTKIVTTNYTNSEVCNFAGTRKHAP